LLLMKELEKQISNGAKVVNDENPILVGGFSWLVTTPTFKRS